MNEYCHYNLTLCQNMSKNKAILLTNNLTLLDLSNKLINLFDILHNIRL